MGAGGVGPERTDPGTVASAGSRDSGVLLSTGPDRFPMRMRMTEEDECWRSRPAQWHFSVHVCI